MVEQVEFLGPYPLDLTEALFNGMSRSLTMIYRWGIPKPQPVGVVAVSNFDNVMVKADEKWGQATPKNLLAIRIASITENYNGFNPSVLLRTGWLAGVTPSGQERIIFHLTPVIVTFDIQFLTDQMATADAYIRNWLHRFRYDAGFDIELHNPDFKFRIQVQGNDSFDYPTDDRTEEAKLTINTQCRAFSYIGHYEAVPTVARINYGAALDPNNTQFVQNNLPNTFPLLLEAELEAAQGPASNNYVSNYMSAWSLNLKAENPELNLPADLLAVQELYENISGDELANMPLSYLGTFTSLTPGR